MRFHAVAAILFLSAALTAAAWQPVGGKMMTPWGETLDPQNVPPEYPRPQMQRAASEGLTRRAVVWDYETPCYMKQRMRAWAATTRRNIVSG